MNPFTPTELAGLRATAESSFMDRCKVAEPTGTGWGQVANPATPPNFDGADEEPCGFDASASDEAQDGTQATITSGVFRFSVDREISVKAHIQLTKRHGETLAVPERYAVIGVPRRGPSAITVQVKRIVGNTTR